MGKKDTVRRRIRRRIRSKLERSNKPAVAEVDEILSGSDAELDSLDESQLVADDSDNEHDYLDDDENDADVPEDDGSEPMFSVDDDDEEEELNEMDKLDAEEAAELAAYIQMKDKALLSKDYGKIVQPRTANFRNDKKLESTLKDIQLAGKFRHDNSVIRWTELLDLSSPLDVIENSQDDIKRELAFYNQALHSVIEGHKKLEEHNVLHDRPTDYFAEMVKTDRHMSKVRHNLLQQQQNIEAAEGRRKQRELKKYGKQIQVQKIQEREKKKKGTIEAVKKWRKERSKGQGDDDFDFEADGDKKGGAKPQGRKEVRKPNPKREAKDKKFGYGGSKKHIKSNNKESHGSFGPNKKIAKETRKSYNTASRKEGGRSGGGGGRGGSRGGRGGSRGGRGGGRGGRR